MGFEDRFTDVRMQVMNLVHQTVLSVSGGRFGASIGQMPVYRITTTGRKSGQPRTVLLTAPVRDGETLIFVASKGGDDRDPDWYRNLVANPECTVEPADGSSPPAKVNTRTATDEEKAELWPRIVDAYRGYEGYQSVTDRKIPVVIAEPVG